MAGNASTIASRTAASRPVRKVPVMNARSATVATLWRLAHLVVTTRATSGERSIPAAVPAMNPSQPPTSAPIANPTAFTPGLIVARTTMTADAPYAAPNTMPPAVARTHPIPMRYPSFGGDQGIARISAGAFR